MFGLLSILNPYKWLIAAGAIALALGGAAIWLHVDRSQHEKIGAENERAIWVVKEAKLKADAATALATETAKTRDVEAKLNAAGAAQKVKDAQNTQTVAGLRAELVRNSRAAGGAGLRDPGAGRGGGSSGPSGSTASGAGSGTANPAPAAGVFSQQFEGMLLDWLGKADDLNLAYASCRQDALSIRALVPK